MKRGEVWWVDDPASGSRPHLLLTRDAAVSLLTAVIAVPATRTVRRIPTEVALDERDGMPGECVLSLDNVTVMPKAFFRERICELSDERMARVCAALELATGCR